MSSDPQKTLFDAWNVLLRYRWRFLMSAFLALILALGASLLLPRKYEAEAMFERRLDMVLNEIMQRGGQKPTQDPRQSLAQELTGPPAIDRVVDRLLPQLQASARRDGHRLDPVSLKAELPRMLIVRFDISTPSLDRVRLSYTSQDPDLARTMVNALVLDYIERTRNEIDRQLRQSETFFEAEVGEARKSIEELENRKLSYEIDHAPLLPESTYSIQVMMQEAQDQLAEVQQKLASSELRLTALQASMQETPATTPSVVTARNPELAQTETRLKELQTTLSLYTGTYKMTDKHPDLVDLRVQIAELQRKLGDLPEQVIKEQRFDNNPKRTELELKQTEAVAERDGLRQQLATVQARVAELDKQGQNLFPIRAEYRKITRQVEQSQRQLAFWEDNLRRVRLALTAETGNRGVQLDLIKPCPELTRPVSPDLWQVLLASLALSLAVGSASTFIAHRTNESFLDGEQLSSTFNLPLMGAVSEIISQQDRARRRMRQMVFYPLHAAGMAAVVVFMAGLVYLQLKAPHQLAKLTSNPIGFVSNQLRSQAPTPSQD